MVLQLNSISFAAFPERSGTLRLEAGCVSSAAELQLQGGVAAAEFAFGSLLTPGNFSLDRPLEVMVLLADVLLCQLL